MTLKNDQNQFGKFVLNSLLPEVLGAYLLFLSYSIKPVPLSPSVFSCPTFTTLIPQY